MNTAVVVTRPVQAGEQGPKDRAEHQHGASADAVGQQTPGNLREDVADAERPQHHAEVGGRHVQGFP